MSSEEREAAQLVEESHTKFVVQPDGDVKEIGGFVSIDEYKGPIAPDAVFSQSQGYGLHIGDAGRIARLQQDNERLIELLASCADFLQGQADTVDSVDGPIPNHAMQLLNWIDQELVGRKL